jgi:hypothetical protein
MQIISNMVLAVGIIAVGALLAYKMEMAAGW